MKWKLALAVACLGMAGAQDVTESVRRAAAGWTQAVVKQDRPALERLLADDLYFAHSNGRSVQTKTEYIASLTAGAPGYEGLTLRDITILPYGQTAVLSAYVDTKHPGSDSFPVRFLQLWVDRGGRWQLAASAATRWIAPGGARGAAGKASKGSAGSAPAAAPPPVADAAPRGSDSGPDAARVREAAEGWTAAVVREDHATLRRLLADDLVFVHSGGGAPQNKAEYIASPENSDYDALPLRDLAIRIYGQTAVLSAFLDTKHKGKAPSPVKTLQIFRQHDGQWQLAAFQATRISPPPESKR